MPKGLGWGVALRVVRGSAALVVIAAVLSPSTSGAVGIGTTFYVGTTADENDGGDCTNNANDDCSLRDAIIASNTNTNPADEDTIDLSDVGPTFALTIGSNTEDSTQVDATVGDLDVTQSVEIPGSSQTIDASGLVRNAGTPEEPNIVPAPDRVFHVTTSGGDQTRLTLSNLTVTGGETTGGMGAAAGSGGGIANVGSYVELDGGVTVTSNVALAAGGGIYAGDPVQPAMTIVDNSIVALNLTGTSIPQAGGGIYNAQGDSLIVRHQSFIQLNKACPNDGSECDGTLEGVGGGIWNGGTATVTATSIDGNVAGQHGGGIYNDAGGDLTVEDGALVEGTGGSTVTNNIAGVDGGGIWNAGHAEVTNSTIGGEGSADGNHAGVGFEDSFEGEGGGIWTQGTFSATLLLTGAVVQGNFAAFHGGGIYNEGDRVVLDDTDVVDNEAGAVCSRGCVHPGGNGGGIWSAAEPFETASPPGLYLEGGSTVAGNRANVCDPEDFDPEETDYECFDEHGQGGGIYNLGHAEVTDGSVVGTEEFDDFSDANTAEDEGGGIWTAAESDKTLIVEDSAVSGNFSSAHGGGIYNDGDRVEITNSSVSNNTAGMTCVECDGEGGNGGGIWSAASAEDTPESPGLYIDDQSTIDGNRALEICAGDSCQGGDGGGIWNAGHTEIGGDSEVNDNFADREGGGIWTSPGGIGGDGCGDCTLLIENGFVEDNDAGHSGGGIFNWFDRVVIDGSEVSGNTAGVGDPCGDGCVAGGNGGGIWSNASPQDETGDQPGLYVSDSSVSENTVLRCSGEVCGPDHLGQGGGIWNNGHAELDDDTSVDDNVAEGDGGGLWTSGPCIGDCCPAPEGCGTALLTDVHVIGNTSGGDGGGIWNGSDFVELLRVTVADNKAGTFLFVQCEGESCEVVEDVVGGNGGGIWSDVAESGYFDARNTTVSGNSAPSSQGGGGFGGGLYLLGDPAAVLHSLTVNGNHAGEAGGNLALNEEVVVPGPASVVYITNTIVSAGKVGPTLDNCFIGENNDIVSQGYNLTDEAAPVEGPKPCSFDQPSDLLGVDPLLAGLMLNPPGLTETHELLVGSPAIDSGAPVTPPFAEYEGPLCLDKDQRTVSRPQGAGCDRGAYERGVQGEEPGGGGPGPSADLSILKTASPDTVQPGDHLVYTLTVKNLGPDAASNVVVTDPLPASETFVSATTTKGSCSHTAGTVTCELGSLAKDETVTITIEVIVGEADTVVNTARVSGTVNDPTTPNNSSTATNSAGGAGTEANCAGLVNDSRLEIIGTPAADLIIGTDADEVICARDGNDVVLGGGGDDEIFGEGGDDYLSGGPGDDTMNGGPGSDWGNYAGAPGAVDADLARGTAIGEGASGRDTSSDQGANTDELEGIENLIGSQFPDRLAGDGGPNELLGKSGADLMLGRRGDDILRGNRGNDRERGGSGDDLVKGGFDNDRLSGGTGNDRQTGGQQNDRVIGNRGNDRLRGGGADDHLNGKAGTDTCRGGQPHNTYVSCEK